MSALSLHDLDRVSIARPVTPMPLIWAREYVLGRMQLAFTFDPEVGEITVNHGFCAACRSLTRREQLKGQTKLLCRDCWEVINVTSVERLIEISAIALQLAEPDYGDDL